MPIFSYIAYPKEEGKDALVAELSAVKGCQAVPAEKEEIVLLVTDTPDEECEKKLQEQLKQIKSLQSLSMTFGHVDEHSRQ